MLLPQDEIVEAIIGGKIEFELALVDENGRPVDTTAYDNFKVCIPISKTSALEVTQTDGGSGSVVTKIGDPQLGVFKIFIAPVDSATLAPGERVTLDFQMQTVADATSTIRVRLPEKMSIFKSSCG